MNKDLAIKISKHPLIKRLLESTNQKEVARLIVEELMNEAVTDLQQLLKQKKSSETGLEIINSIENAEDLKGWIDAFSNGVDKFNKQNPEYFKKRKIEPEKYKKEKAESIVDFVNNQAENMFKLRGEEGFKKAMTAIFGKSTTSFGLEDGRKKVLDSLTKIILKDLKQEDDNTFDLDKTIEWFKTQDPNSPDSTIANYFEQILKKINTSDDWYKLKDVWNFFYDNKDQWGIDLKSEMLSYDNERKKRKESISHNFKSKYKDVFIAAYMTSREPLTSNFFIKNAFKAAKLMAEKATEINKAIEQEEEEQASEKKKEEPQQSGQDPKQFIADLKDKSNEKLKTLESQYNKYKSFDVYEDVEDKRMEIGEAVKKYSVHYNKIMASAKETVKELENLLNNIPDFIGKFSRKFRNAIEPVLRQFKFFIKQMNIDKKAVIDFVKSRKQDMEANIDKNKEQLEKQKAELEAAKEKLAALPPETPREDLKAMAKDEIDKVAPEASKEVKNALVAKVLDMVGAEKDDSEDPYSDLKEKYGNTEFMQSVPEDIKNSVYKLISIFSEQNLLTEKSLAASMKESGFSEEQIRAAIAKLDREDKLYLDKLFKDEKTSFKKFLKMLKGGALVPTDKESKPSPETEKLEVDPKTAQEYIKAVEELQNDFYRKRYKIQQAEIIRSVIDAIAKIAGEEGKELSYQRVSTETEGEAEALQEGKEITADDKEIKDLRIAFRSFLSLVNKTKKALAKFEDEAGRGSVLARSSKKDFMNLLKRLQDTIAKLVASIKQILDTPEEQLQEVTKEEMLNRWKEVQEAYDKTIEANSALKELLKGEGEGASDDVVNLAYSTALNLSQYFPSVNPFNKGAQSKADLTRYKDTFQSAIDDVKESLQYVVNIATRGIVNASSLYESSEALQEFSEKIKDIFGVEGPISGDYNPKSEPAAEGKPTQPAPEAVVYEEFDIEDLYAVLQKHKDTYEKAKKLIKTGSLNEDKRLANLKKVENEFHRQSYDLESMFGVLDDVDSQSKKSIIKAAQTFVELYDELQVVYETLKGKEIGEPKIGIYSRFVKDAERAFDEMEKSLSQVIKELSPENLKKYEKEKIDIEKIYNHYFKEYLEKLNPTGRPLANSMILFIGNIIKAIDEEKSSIKENIAQVTTLMPTKYTKYVISAYKHKQSNYQREIIEAIRDVGDLEFAKIIKQIIDDYISKEIYKIIYKAKPEEEDSVETSESALSDFFSKVDNALEDETLTDDERSVLERFAKVEETMSYAKFMKKNKNRIKALAKKQGIEGNDFKTLISAMKKLKKAGLLKEYIDTYASHLFSDSESKSSTEKKAKEIVEKIKDKSEEIKAKNPELDEEEPIIKAAEIVLRDNSEALKEPGFESALENAADELGLTDLDISLGDTDKLDLKEPSLSLKPDQEEEEEPEEEPEPEPEEEEEAPEEEEPGGELEKMKEYLEPLVGKDVLYKDYIYTLRGIITPEDGDYVEKYKEFYKDVDPKLESFQDYLEKTQKSKRIAICLFDYWESTITVIGEIENLDDLKNFLTPPPEPDQEEEDEVEYPEKKLPEPKPENVPSIEDDDLDSIGIQSDMIDALLEKEKKEKLSTNQKEYIQLGINVLFFEYIKKKLSSLEENIFEGIASSYKRSTIKKAKKHYFKKLGEKIEKEEDLSKLKQQLKKYRPENENIARTLESLFDKWEYKNKDRMIQDYKTSWRNFFDKRASTTGRTIIGALNRVFVYDEGKIEEQIANKLKPLIKEMLRRN